MPEWYNDKTALTNAVWDELVRAREKFHPFNSTHEGYAVMLEEMDELWDAIKSYKACTRINLTREEQAALRKECIQIAAMALRFITDLSD